MKLVQSNRVQYLFLGLIVVTMLILAGCRSTKEVESVREVPNRKTDELLDLMAEHELKCEWLNLKYEVEIKSEKIDDSFKMYIRMRQDSAIWVSATYYAVEVARFLFLPDTMKFMDRKNNKFYVGDYSYLKDRFQVDGNFDVLQALILSNSSELLNGEDSKERKLKSSRGEGVYLIDFIHRGVRRRMMRRDEGKDESHMEVGLQVDPSTFRIKQTTITELESERTLNAAYSEFKEVCNSSFPYVSEFSVSAPNQQAKVKTSVMKLAADKEVSLSFTIPDKYEALVP